MIAKPEANEITRASLELLYHISRELTADLELNIVLRRVLNLSMEAVGAVNGSIIVLDDHGRAVDSIIIIGDHIHDRATQQLRDTLDRGLAGWVVRNKQAVLVEDTSRDERWMVRQYELEESTGPRSAVSAPLLARDKLVGVMTLAHGSSNFFKQNHLSLVRAIADQAGIFVLNARYYTESQRQARVMTALAESAMTITASLDLQDVLSRILEQIVHALDVQAVSLALIDQETQELVYQAATGWGREKVHGVRTRIEAGVAGMVAQTGEGKIVQDVEEDPLIDTEVESRIGFPVKTIACAPIRYGGEVVGVLEAINSLEGLFEVEDLYVLEGIGSLAGTAIRHAQLFEQLHTAHQRYRELFEDSIDPILISNWEGEILEANRQAVEATGYTEQDLLEMEIGQLHQIDYQQVGDRFKNLAFPETINYDSVLNPQNMGEVPMEVYVRQIEVNGENRLQWILRDITERVKLDEMREDLISMIYHDLRSPLSNVISSLDVLISNLSDEEFMMQKSLLEIARRSTERIQRLTDSLLDVSRMEAGQKVGDRRELKPDQLLEEAAELVQPYIVNRGLILEKKIGEILPTIFGDADMLRRVLTNLLENAIKFSPGDSKVQIGIDAEDKWVRFWVKDEGTGIPPEDHELIFDKFSRLNVEGAPKGLGLGLAYCRLAVEAHGGRIWVESEPGKGSCFIFVLPRVEDIEQVQE